jgi:hypothetical protein
MAKGGNGGGSTSNLTYTAYVFTAGVVDYTGALSGAESKTLNGVSGHLLTIESQAENDLIDSWVYDLSFYSWNGGPVIWLGISDNAEEGSWRYTSGPNTGEVASYTNWFPGEPNGGTGENYGTLNTAAQTSDGTVYSGTWFDAWITYTFNVIGYVTEFDGLTSKPSASTLPDNCLVLASNGALILVGDANANRLTGGTNNDEIYGRAGNDIIIGNSGTDKLTGGSEQDVFVFSAVTDTAVGKKRDVISDFVAADDTIDFRTIDANPLTAADDAFTYIGLQSFSGTAGELRFFKGLVSGDVNGDRAADFQIELTNVQSLSVDDFIL